MARKVEEWRDYAEAAREIRYGLRRRRGLEASPPQRPPPWHLHRWSLFVVIVGLGVGLLAIAIVADQLADELFTISTGHFDRLPTAQVPSPTPAPSDPARHGPVMGIALPERSAMATPRPILHSAASASVAAIPNPNSTHGHGRGGPQSCSPCPALNGMGGEEEP